ncbi:MAG: HEAT repeat domain-containing protein [Actinomycetes bacterium]
MSASDSPEIAELRRAIVIAGHTGDSQLIQQSLSHEHGSIREAALGALARIDQLNNEVLQTFASDTDSRVRIRVAELAATLNTFDLVPLLNDKESQVIEMAAWACGEHESARDEIMNELIRLVVHHDDALVREAAVAALGAIGDESGLPAILSACQDKPAIRRRAVLALAPFDSPEVEKALKVALEDRDWQVRQAAEDLLG